MLVERLNWPVRLVRWRAAREYAALLTSKEFYRPALDVYLEWLSTRTFESEVTSALAVLLCTPEDGLPAFNAVRGYISRPSLLADAMLQFVYGPGKVKGGWEKSHSGPAPPSFVAEEFFLNHKSAHVPPALGSRLEDLEKESGLPFMTQWAFEWRSLMDTTKAPHSGFPYFFVDFALHRSGITGQFSQRQCDVYRSAFLRTLACAVDHWKMPVPRAGRAALECLPINRGLAEIDPIQRPVWLHDVPERCCNPGAQLEPLVRELTKPGLGRPGMRPVSLKVPISADQYEFADLFVSGVLATEDYASDPSWEHRNSRALPWILEDAVSFAGKVDEEKIEDFLLRGTCGKCVPLCLDVLPLPLGFWQGDFFAAGIALPAPYVFVDAISYDCRGDRIEVTADRTLAGSWTVWYDRWTPLYAHGGGDTRCGMLTELRPADIDDAAKRHAMRLGWIVELRIWKRKTDYGDFELEQRRDFFWD